MTTIGLFDIFRLIRNTNLSRRVSSFSKVELFVCDVTFNLLISSSFLTASSFFLEVLFMVVLLPFAVVNMTLITDDKESRKNKMKQPMNETKDTNIQ